MNLQEDLKMKGELSIRVFDRNGNLKEAIHHPNLVVTVGKNYIASRMTGNGTTVMGYMGIGTGTSTPAAGDQKLGTESYRAALGTSGGVATNNTVQYTATFGPGNGSGAITEAGIFNNSTMGEGDGTLTKAMLCRTTFPPVNKDTGDSIAITWTVTVS